MSPRPAIEESAIAEDATAITLRAWEALKQNNPGLQIVTVPEFTGSVDRQSTSLADRLTIIAQASAVFLHFYPHLHFKKRLYETADPVEALAKVAADAPNMSETDFHAAVLRMFDRVRDAHTLYAMPAPFRHAIAILPFEMRGWVDGEGRNRYSVTRMLDAGDGNGFGHPYFAIGAEITRWNGLSIDDFIAKFAQDQPGGNVAAMLSRFAIGATIRPLTWIRLESESADLTVIGYIPEGESTARAIALPWGVMTGLANSNKLPNGAFSISHSMSLSHLARTAMWSGGAAPQSDDPEVSTIPEAFYFACTGGTSAGGGPAGDEIDPALLVDARHPDAKFGYIQIKRFSCDRPGLPLGQTLVDEFKRILLHISKVAPDGLIIDVRGNPGGDVQAAERMLQMLTPDRISPATFHFANTPAIQAIIGLLKKQPAHPGDSVQLVNARRTFADWLDDPLSPPETNPLTTGRVLTPPDAANDTGQLYLGKVVLLIDGLTYSAADIFAAGFQDHQIGPIIGSASNTGGGGAQVWQYHELLSNVPELPGISLQSLPGDATITLAIRRCLRVNRHLGEAIEDVGVQADLVHHVTKRDLVDSADLLAFACHALCSVPATDGL